MENALETENPAPRTIEAEDLQARCGEVLDELAATGRPLVITRGGKPVARLEAAVEAKPSPFGRGKDIMRVVDPDDDLEDIIIAEDLGPLHTRAEKLRQPTKQ